MLVINFVFFSQNVFKKLLCKGHQKLSFCGKGSFNTQGHIDKFFFIPIVLCKFQSGKHDAIVKNVHDLLAKLAWDFAPDQLDHLFECFQVIIIKLITTCFLF